MLNAIILGVVMLSVTFLNVVMHNVVAPSLWLGWRRLALTNPRAYTTAVLIALVRRAEVQTPKGTLERDNYFI
jgi:hypothetical protein